MALLELFEQLTLKVEYNIGLFRLEKTSDFPGELRESLLKMLDFSEWIHKENLAKLSNMKGDIILHFTLPKLFSLKIKTEMSVFAAAMHSLS